MTGLLGNDVRIFIESPIPICIIFRQVTATIIITVRSPPVLEVLAGCVYTVLLGVYYFYSSHTVFNLSIGVLSVIGSIGTYVYTFLPISLM